MNFSKISVEIDLSKGLRDHTHLAHKYFKRYQILHLENITFKCQIVQEIGKINAHKLEILQKGKKTTPKVKLIAE